MIDLLRPFRSLAAALRRWLSRRAARRLVGQSLPRGLLPAPERPFALALRVPLALEAPPGEFWTLPLGAQAIRGRAPSRLLRLSALPPPPRKLDVVQEMAPREPPPPPRLPDQLVIAPPLVSRVHDLGQASPAHFRLDADLRLPPEIDPPRLASDAPAPSPSRSVRPRTPLARAPLNRLRPRHFRLDPRSGEPANEGIVQPVTPYTGWWWIHPELRREKVDLPWMAQERIRFIAPLQTEWFMMWWDQIADRKPGGKDPQDYELPRELSWALEECKEQMLIRRDVKKDEEAPPDQRFRAADLGPTMSTMESAPISEIVPPPQWIEVGQTLEPLPFDRGLREVYLQWRTLLDGLEER